MSNVLKSMKLDNYILKANYKMFVALYVVATVIAVVTKIPVLAQAIVTLISAPFIGLFFSICEKDNLGKLYGILPLARSETVVGRFLYALSVGVVNGMISVALAYIISLVTGNGLDHLTFIAVVSASFLYFSLFIAILFPVYFKFPFSRVYMLVNLPIYLLGVASMFVLRKTDLLQSMGQVVQYFTSNQEMIWITGFGLGLILLAVSCLLSCVIYQKREL